MGYKKRWKTQWSQWTRSQKALGGVYSKKKRIAKTPQPGFEFYKTYITYTVTCIKPCHKYGIFKCISWLNGSFLGGDDRGFPKVGWVKTYYWMIPILPPNLTNLFLSSHHLYSQWIQPVILCLSINFVHFFAAEEDSVLIVNSSIIELLCFLSKTWKYWRILYVCSFNILYSMVFIFFCLLVTWY